jgi:hypothetical protein
LLELIAAEIHFRLEAFAADDPRSARCSITGYVDIALDVEGLDAFYGRLAANGVDMFTDYLVGRLRVQAGADQDGR